MVADWRDGIVQHRGVQRLRGADETVGNVLTRVNVAVGGDTGYDTRKGRRGKAKTAIALLRRNTPAKDSGDSARTRD